MPSMNRAVILAYTLLLLLDLTLLRDGFPRPNSERNYTTGRIAYTGYPDPFNGVQTRVAGNFPQIKVATTMLVPSHSFKHSRCF